MIGVVYRVPLEQDDGAPVVEYLMEVLPSEVRVTDWDEVYVFAIGEAVGVEGGVISILISFAEARVALFPNTSSAYIQIYFVLLVCVL